MVCDQPSNRDVTIVYEMQIVTEANGLERSREAKEEVWYIYILRCKDDSLYMGISTDPRVRLREHNAGRGAEWVRDHDAAKLVYVESAMSYLLARNRESQLKKWSRIKKERLIAGTI